jgi:4-hydroxythreonine-4-phosphate dehydrogenase
VERGVELALAGEVQGLVTGPVHKPSLRAAGAAYTGHTELLAHLTGAPEVGMLMHADSTSVGGPLRILLATTHLALRDVPRRITRELIEGQVGLLHGSLVRWWGLAAPRIALCALNPHASDGGLFGDEEARVLRPAAAALRARGIEVTDPLPADTVFLRAAGGHADAVVVPYHDVGMAVFKTLSFGRGVNVTLGLPFPRTSPDHGTAFDLVDTGLADPSSTVEALRLAARLAAAARSPTPDARTPL